MLYSPVERVRSLRLEEGDRAPDGPPDLVQALEDHHRSEDPRGGVLPSTVMRRLEQRGGGLPGDKPRQVPRLCRQIRRLGAPIALGLALLSQHKLFTYRENQTNFLFRNLYHLQGHLGVNTPRSDEHFV